MSELERARDLAESGDLDNAYRITDKHLHDDPNAVSWLALMTYLMLSSGKPTIAYQLAKRVTQLAPKGAGGWMNLGLACNDLWRVRESERAFERALKLCQSPEQTSMIALNMASLLIDVGRFKDAKKFCHMAMESNDESEKAVANLGFCQLALREWEEGWKNYHRTIGRCDWRPIMQYNNEPEWDGKGTGTIVLYADQGLGDVISFSSIVPDVLDWARDTDSTIILDVDQRLAPLLARSFPEAVVYGTRGNKHINWKPEHHKVDYSLPLGQVGEFFRLTDESFPGTGFLTPDPDRVIQWESLFREKTDGVPVIGIAWQGGIPKTGSKFRRWDLEQLYPILSAVDAHWVSLQYKPAGKEIAAFKEKHPDIDIVEYKHGTLTADYDDTVALIAALDEVICMQTAVTHVCGGLEKPCRVFVPQNSQWRYGAEGSDFVWANSVEIIRQRKRGHWADVIQEQADALRERYADN